MRKIPTGESLTKDKITTDGILRIFKEEAKNHPEDIDAQGLSALRNLVKIGKEIERKKWLSAVRLLKEKIGEKRKEQAIILQELKQEIKDCEKCDDVRCINHEQRVGQWYGINHTISELEEWISEVFAGVGK